MKIILIFVIFALVSAAPKVGKLGYRNLYKEPLIPVVSKTPRIIGGQEAQPNTIPWQAFLEVYTVNKGWYCGGSLISENYIVTAAHCGDDGRIVYINLGAHRPQEVEDTQIFIVSNNITIHKDYDEDKIINDIGVIALPESVQLTDAIQTVKLPSPGNDYVGQTARASGWGKTDGDANTISEVLNYVDLEVISTKDCEKVFGSLPDTILCTSGGLNSGTCSGDSGGPLVINDTLIGISSFVVKGCLKGYASGFTRVTSFLDWLAEKTDV